MSIYILDTDHLSLFQRGHPKITGHFQQVPAYEIAITIITAEEQLRGRLAQIRAARSETEHVSGLRWFRETLDLLKDFNILDYDSNASVSYEILFRQKIRIGTQDLRIAAITLSIGGILVTRNQVDFGQVPGLVTKDWTI